MIDYSGALTKAHCNLWRFWATQGSPLQFLSYVEIRMSNLVFSVFSVSAVCVYATLGG